MSLYVMTLLNKHLLSGAQGASWLAMVQENIKKEAEIEKFITYRTWKKYMVFLEGATWESQAEYRQTVRYAFIKVHGWNALEFLG